MKLKVCGNRIRLLYEEMIPVLLLSCIPSLLLPAPLIIEAIGNLKASHLGLGHGSQNTEHCKGTAASTRVTET